MRAVVRWCQKNFTLEHHPGFEPGNSGTDHYQGLYYYYHTMAKSLRAYGRPEFTDGDGVSHKWAKELAEKLLSLRNEDGTFKNDKNQRWEESVVPIATSYAVLALIECRAVIAAE